ncbi:MAG TPA: hypothetical protein VMT52_16650, partial [Planctomycetota bacterium]|nr:hypothetical protein [Planctomycetota bacterium]
MLQLESSFLRVLRALPLFLAVAFTDPAGLLAHQCGPTQIQLAHGEIFHWQITADLTEVLSDYTPLDTGNPNVAIISPAIPFLDHHGLFTIVATGFGETTFKVHWFYEETGFSGV